jgi:hypothetical protein
MSTQCIAQQQPTAKPVIGGIIDIIVGAGALLALSILGLIALVVSSVTLPFVGIVLAFIAIPILAVPVVALVGGICATQRRSWGWALAGSIATTLMANVFGLVAIVLVALSRGEFVKR